MSLELCDEFGGALGWSEPGFLSRTSHAVAVDGKVLVFDPVNASGIDERIRALGEPEAVVQLLDRHDRDCAAVAARLGIPHRRMELGGSAPQARLLRIAWNPVWKEVAFWEPERRVLVVGDALGTVAYFTAPDERIGVHPFLRLRPPRALAGLGPRHVLCGHGAGLHGEEAAPALEEALATARRRIPPWLAGQVRRNR
ncbi:MAG TPA: hypothetical protein VNB65_07695 [Gaiellaceae bacterium]|jgi:hypothetical protein|nr:hypothetical protein [Gaiellaceae bacterium]